MKMSVAAGTSRFVSKKVRKVRWRPRADSMQSGSDMLATGSWDDEVNDVSLWKYSEDTDNSISLLASLKHEGDVTGLSWLNPDLLATSSSRGGVSLYRLEQYKILTPGQSWTDLHAEGGATCLSIHGESVATAGQDGKINVLNVRQRAAVKVFDKADSCSITDLVFSRSSDLLSSNMRGQIKLFDLRSNKSEPSSTFLLSNEQVAITCLAKHPSQGHIVISGGENGFLAVWDLRQGSHPTTLLSAHQTIKEIMDRLVKTLGKTKEVLEEEAIASEAKLNPANFCRRLGFDRHCICETPGQVPCPSIVPVPRHWRGKWYNQGHRWDED